MSDADVSYTLREFRTMMESSASAKAEFLTPWLKPGDVLKGRPAEVFLSFICPSTDGVVLELTRGSLTVAGEGLTYAQARQWLAAELMASWLEDALQERGWKLHGDRNQCDRFDAGCGTIVATIAGQEYPLVAAFDPADPLWPKDSDDLRDHAGYHVKGAARIVDLSVMTFHGWEDVVAGIAACDPPQTVPDHAQAEWEEQGRLEEERDEYENTHCADCGELVPDELQNLGDDLAMRCPACSSWRAYGV